jgi:hypothetical protein
MRGVRVTGSAALLRIVSAAVHDDALEEAGRWSRAAPRVRQSM